MQDNFRQNFKWRPKNIVRSFYRKFEVISGRNLVWGQRLSQASRSKRDARQVSAFLNQVCQNLYAERTVNSSLDWQFVENSQQSQL